MTPADNLSWMGDFACQMRPGWSEMLKRKRPPGRIAAGDKLKALDYAAGVLRAAR
jgi:hypothetical protein